MNDVELAEQLQIPREMIERWRSLGARIPEDPTDPAQLSELARWLGEREEQGIQTGAQFPQNVLNIGFVGAITLAGVLFLATVIYLGTFLASASDGVTQLVQDVNTDKIPADSIPTVVAAQMIVVKTTLLSCGIFVGAAVAFLGFSLLLLGVKGSMTIGPSRGGWQSRLMILAPGALVLLCAAILVGVCATGDLSLSTDFSTSGVNRTSDTKSEESREQVAVAHESTADLL